MERRTDLPGQQLQRSLNCRPAKGTYALLLRITTGRSLIVGKLGPREFPEGYYLYLGSALNGLEARVRRHLRRDKKPHWHIDVLTNAETVVKIWWSEGEERRECIWAEAALDHPGASIPVPGFGSSDCRCSTHLVRFSTRSQVRSLRQLIAPDSYMPGTDLAGR